MKNTGPECCDRPNASMRQGNPLKLHQWALSRLLQTTQQVSVGCSPRAAANLHVATDVDLDRIHQGRNPRLTREAPCQSDSKSSFMTSVALGRPTSQMCHAPWRTTPTTRRRFWRRWAGTAPWSSGCRSGAWWRRRLRYGSRRWSNDLCCAAHPAAVCYQIRESVAIDVGGPNAVSPLPGGIDDVPGPGYDGFKQIGQR